jgi:DNA-binding MarR family transcriptional regulator
MSRSNVDAAAPLDLSTLPGHLIRRLQQIAVAVFLQETAESGITPVQFAALQTVANQPGIDQRSLARAIGFDTSTIAGVVDRLQARGLLQRQVSSADKRARQLTLTAAGAKLLAAVLPGMQRAQARILAPLPKGERAVFLRMLAKLVSENNELSRAPSEAP